MTAWSDGYVADVGYTAGFYRELAPTWLQYACDLTRTQVSAGENAFTYCDLGCGQGFATLAVAAQYPDATFHGIDFNPAQIANARDLARRAGVKNVHFHDLSFEQARDADSDVLPSFDMVVLHGIYAWIGPENKQAIVDFLDRFLKPGGLVYVSYNAMPGWASMAPVQRLLAEHAERNPDRSDRQIRAGMDYLETLREVNLAYFTANPQVGRRMDTLTKKNASYLAHEFLNKHWTPLYHGDVRADFADAKLDFAGSAALLENFETLSIPEGARGVAQDAADDAMLELIKDVAINQQFRRDLFVKGRRPMSRVDEVGAIRDRRFTLLTNREDVTFTVKTPIGEATGDEEVYTAVTDALAAGETRVRDILTRTGLDLPRVNQALAVLCASNQAHVLRSDTSKGATKGAKRFNTVVADRVVRGDTYGFLAAPAIGSAIPAGTVNMAAYDILRNHDVRDADTLGRSIWERLRRRGTRLLRDGEPLETHQENQDEAIRQAEDVLTNVVPLWKHLDVM